MSFNYKTNKCNYAHSWRRGNILHLLEIFILFVSLITPPPPPHTQNIYFDYYILNGGTCNQLQSGDTMSVEAAGLKPNDRHTCTQTTLSEVALSSAVASFTKPQGDGWMSTRRQEGLWTRFLSQTCRLLIVELLALPVRRWRWLGGRWVRGYGTLPESNGLGLRVANQTCARRHVTRRGPTSGKTSL